MSEIFISYSRTDRPRVEKLAAALQREGFSLWWDKAIEGGAIFTKETEAQLKAATVVLVAWSAASVESNWVADEASYGRDRSALVPIAIDDVEPKLGFRQFQTIDFRKWRGDPSAPEFGELVRALRARLGADAPTPAPAPRAKAPYTDYLRRPAALTVIALLLAAVIVAAILLPSGARRPQAAGSAEEAAAPESAKKAAGVGLAVLPFVNMSSDPEQEHFADGLTEELLNWLANVEGLNVPGRTTSFQFKGDGHDLRELGARLGVEYILEGSVRRSGDALRVTAQLIEASSGFHLWSETYDRKLADIFAIQDEIARLVTTELLGAIPESGAENPAAVGDVDPKAHELYLEGRALWATRDFDKAFQKFRAATDIDPGHALAQAYLSAAAAQSFGANLGIAPDTDFKEIAAAALRKAVSLRPESSDVLFAQGWLTESRTQFTAGPGDAAGRAAAQFYESAVRANPRNVEALYARSRYIEDDKERAAYLRRIVEIDPGHMRAAEGLAQIHARAGDFAAAKTVFDRLYTVAPGTPRAGASVIYFENGDLESSAEALLRDFDGMDLSEFEGAKRAARLADLGAVEEAAFLYETGAASGLWRVYGAAQAAMLRGDYRQYQKLAEEIHAFANPPPWSGALLANASLIIGDNQGAYRVLSAEDPNVGAVVEFDDGNGAADYQAFNAAVALGRLGRREEAAAIWKRALAASDALEARARWPRHIGRAIIHAQLGDADLAFRELEAAHDAGFRSLYGFLCFSCVDPAFFAEKGVFEPIFDDPRFKAYVDRIRKENADTLERLDSKYGFLENIRARMNAADGAAGADDPE